MRYKISLAASLAATLLTLLINNTSMFKKQTHNPLNIRQSTDVFIGEVPSPNSAFKVFREDVYGVRAAILIIITYRRKYNIKTVQRIIQRWAPPTENDTDAYIDFVVKKMPSGTTPFTEVTKDNLYDLLKAMAKIESNYTLSRETYDKAVELSNSSFTQLLK